MDYNQQLVLGLLKEIDSICKPNGIPFYLGAGSMIGAIRHGGFIPWDDDADIYMKRKDWNRFVEAFNEHPIPDRKLLSPDIAPESCYTIHRYIDTSTTQLYRYHLASPQADGIMIDVLVLDEIPDDVEGQLEHIRLLTEYSNVLVRATSFSHKCPVDIDMKPIRRRVRRLGRQRVLEEYESRLFDYPEGMCHHYVQCDAGVPHVWPKDVFGDPLYVPFEDTELPVATHVFEALTGAFDEDWNYIPDSAGQETHIVTMDFYIGGSLIYDDATKRFNKKRLQRNYEKRNNAIMDTAAEQKRLQEQSTEFYSSYVQFKYRREGLRLNDVGRWLEEGDYQELKSHYALYLRFQCSKPFVGGPSYEHWYRAHYPLYIDLGDDFLYGALRLLLHDMRIGQVRKILWARCMVGGEPSEQIRSVIDEYNRTFKMLCTYWDGDHDGSLEAARRVLESFPGNPYALEIQLRDDARMGRPSAEKRAMDLFEAYDSNAYSVRYLADRALESGDEGRALELYRLLIEQRDDGITLKELRDDLAGKGEATPLSPIEQLVFRAATLRLSGDKEKACDVFEGCEA